MQLNPDISSLPSTLPQPTLAELVEGSQAIKEADAFASGVDLSSRKDLNKFNSLLRSDEFERHVHKITVIAIYMVGGLIGLMFVSLILQYILPDKLRYLTEAEILELQEFLFSGTIGGVITVFAKKAFSSDQ